MKEGADIESLKKKLSMVSNLEVFLDIKEVEPVEAEIAAENIANQLEKEFHLEELWKAVQSSGLGAKGVKVVCSGRLGGLKLVRTEKYLGSVPLYTLRSDIDYATASWNYIWYLRLGMDK